MHEIASLFRCLNTGVYVIGVADGEKRNAFTASSLMQVSYRPLLVALSVNPENASYPLLRASGGFTVSVLEQDQLDLARHFGTLSGCEHDKLAGIAWHASYRGAPILNDALAFLECEVTRHVSAGDHELIVARVIRGAVRDPDAEPMRYVQTGDMDGSSVLYPATFRDDLPKSVVSKNRRPQITFDADAVLDATTNAFIFFGRMDGEPIQCAVTQEAIVAGFDIPAAKACLPEVFASRRDAIHSAAARLILERRWEPGGGIILRQGDMRRATGTSGPSAEADPEA